MSVDRWSATGSPRSKCPEGHRKGQGYRWCAARDSTRSTPRTRRRRTPRPRHHRARDCSDDRRRGPLRARLDRRRRAARPLGHPPGGAGARLRLGLHDRPPRRRSVPAARTRVARCAGAHRRGARGRRPVDRGDDRRRRAGRPGDRRQVPPVRGPPTRHRRPHGPHRRAQRVRGRGADQRGGFPAIRPGDRHPRRPRRPPQPDGREPDGGCAATRGAAGPLRRPDRPVRRHAARGPAGPGGPTAAWRWCWARPRSHARRAPVPAPAHGPGLRAQR